MSKRNRGVDFIVPKLDLRAKFKLPPKHQTENEILSKLKENPELITDLINSDPSKLKDITRDGSKAAMQHGGMWVLSSK